MIYAYEDKYNPQLRGMLKVGITPIDLSVMLLSVAPIWLFSRTRYTVERWEGALLVAGYLVYLGWLLYNV